MCRFVFYKGDPITLSSLITEPEHSIIHQSYQSLERKEPLNGDGFGIAWYSPETATEPAVFKEISPAWSNQNLLNIARVVRSGCILGHVRAATSGLAVIRPNCHPFAWRDFSFMHNGFIGGFAKIRRNLQAELSDEAFATIGGSTDSEHVFALFIDEILQHGNPETAEQIAERLAGAMARVEAAKKAAGIARHSQLNFAVTNGRHSVVTRYVSDPSKQPNTLYVVEGKSYSCVDGEIHLSPSGSARQAVLIASEPLSSSEDWREVEPNHQLLIDANNRVEIKPLTLGV